MLLAFVAVSPVPAQSRTDRAGEPRRIVIAPQNAVLEPGGRLVLEAFADFDDDTSDRIPCRWRLLAQRGQARLAVGRGPTVIAKIEAGVAPAFVVVEAVHELEDGVLLRAQTTVLCSKPILTAPARVAVGEAAPVEVSLPLLPIERPGRISVDVMETPDGPVDPKTVRLGPQPEPGRKPAERPRAPQPTHGARFVRMEDGVFGPVGANYAVRMPVVGGSLQMGVVVPRPGRWVLRGTITLGEGTQERTLYTDPVVIQAFDIARIRVLSYGAGPPSQPGDELAGPSGHAVAGPVVLDPPQAVAPVVVGYAADGEPLGILSRSTVRFGQMAEVKERRVMSRDRLPMGMLYIDGGFPGRPPSGSVVQRPVVLHEFAAVGIRDQALQGGFVVAEPVPVAVVPLPVDASVRLSLVLQGMRASAVLAPLNGRSAYLLKPPDGEPGTGALPSEIAAVESVSATEARIDGLAPGLVRVRSRCKLIDREGGSAPLRMVTEVLVVAHDQVVWCDLYGRPCPVAGPVVQAVLGAAKVLVAGKHVTPVFPADAPFEAAGTPVQLQRDGGWCWVVPVKRKQP